MAAAGIIAEYNPLHSGHVYLFDEVRRLMGPDCGIVCVMSGSFVQRGDLAIIGKRARAAAAVQSGADLVLELPLPWAAAPAEAFAYGGVSVLAAAGIVDRLVFGSESGDAAPLDQIAGVLLSEAFPPLLRRELLRGDSFAAARERAVGALLSPETAALLESPNNILGVEYCKALRRLGRPMTPLAIPRRGMGHRDLSAEGLFPSASAIRALVRAGERDRALQLMAPAMAEAYAAEESAGRGPALWENCQRAILARLRSMSREDFAVLDQGREGLGNRLWQASREASSLPEILALAKTKRYPMARMRRMTLWACLGMRPVAWTAPPYLRPLAANARGRVLLARMRKSAALPVLTKAAQVRRLPEEARRLFELECRAADLYALSYPRLSAAKGGMEWRSGPVML